MSASMEILDNTTAPVILSSEQMSQMIRSLAHHNKFSALYLWGEKKSKKIGVPWKKESGKAKKSKDSTIRKEDTEEALTEDNINFLLELMDLDIDVFTAKRIPIQYPSETGVTLKEFLCFNRLPAELRLKIWQFTWARELVIPLVTDKHTLQWNSYCRAPPIPPALHIHQESRAEAQKIFKCCFDDSTTPRVVVNFKTDIFWINGIYGQVDVPKISADPEADEAAQNIQQNAGTSGWIYNSFIKADCAENFDKIERLMVSIPCSKRQLKQPGTDPMRLHGLPAHLKELLVISAIKGRRMLFARGRGVRFVEDDDKGYVEGEEDEPNYNGHGKQWWRQQKAEITEAYELAKKNSPDWKAPMLKFGMDVPINPLCWHCVEGCYMESS